MGQQQQHVNKQIFYKIQDNDYKDNMHCIIIASFFTSYGALSSIRVFYSVMGVRDEIFALGGLVPMVGICKITEKYSIKENKWTPLMGSSGGV